MSSTNKTANYNLSQFIGTDKPAWLTDYNSDMSKIDAGIDAAKDTADAASGSASAANTAIGTLANLSTTAKTDLVSAINEVDTNADTAQGTANSAQVQATANATAIASLADYLNISTFTTPVINYTNFTSTSTATVINCASNSTGSLGKIYGLIAGTANANTFTITFPTPLRPNETITVNGIVDAFYYDTTTSSWRPTPKSITIATDGTATIYEDATTSNRQYRIVISACVIFAKSFGDLPQPD